MSLNRYRTPEEALKRLTERRKEIEREFEQLGEKFKKGEIDNNTFNEKRKKLEREFIEIMDRLAQLKYITGEEAGKH